MINWGDAFFTGILVSILLIPLEIILIERFGEKKGGLIHFIIVSIVIFILTLIRNIYGFSFSNILDISDGAMRSVYELKEMINN